MLQKISTPILIAILIYHGYRYYTHWSLEKSLDAYKTEKLADRVQYLKHHKDEIVQKATVIKVSESVYVAVGYAFANSIMFIGTTGIVIIDTTENEDAAKLIYEDFRKITDKPLLGIIYTHNHVDHVAGTSSFFDNGTRPQNLEIWAHHSLISLYHQSMQVLGEAHFRRSMRQFGGFLDKKQSSRGFNTKLDVGKPKFLIPPNKFLYQSTKDILIGGMNLRLLHVPGETDDQIAVYWPDQNVLLCGDDFYKAFPNLYAIRGTSFRSLKLWYESLDIMRNIGSHVLISSHTTPVYGKENVLDTLTHYRDAVQFVHDQTVRYINKGWHPDEIVQRIQMPATLAEKSYLQELYGTVKWSSKGLFAGYMGWFGGDIVELEPHTPNEQAKRLVRLAGGIDNLLNNAQQYLDDNDAQWALRLSSAALRHDPQNEKAKELKAKSLYDMAARQTSMNGYNYYVSSAQETLGKIEIKLRPEMKSLFAKSAKMKDIFYKMSLRIKGEACPHLNKIVLFVFPDTGQEIKFHMRNGIMDLGENVSGNPDVKVSISSVVWREIVAGERSGLVSAATSQLTVEPGLTSLQEVMACVDTD